MNTKDIETILRAAAAAPSGHNYQPWRFRVSGAEIVFENAPENDTTIYNFNQRGSYIGHGAAVENALVAANALGYETKIELLPKGKGAQATASMTLTPDPQAKDDARALLSPSIAKRATNRKPYGEEKITQTLERITRLPADLEGKGKIVFIEDRNLIEKVAEAWSVNDWLIFNARIVHGALFPHLVWSKKEEKRKRSGLFIETFELPPPVKVMFRLFRSWAIARIFGKIGFGNIAAKQNRENVYTKTPAIGAVLVGDLEPGSLLVAGRIFEHLWLSAVSEGLSIQPLMGAYYLALRAEEDTTLPLNAGEKRKLAEAKEALRSVFSKNGMIPAVMFRIGRGDAPSAYSSKKDPVVVFS